MRLKTRDEVKNQVFESINDQLGIGDDIMSYVDMTLRDIGADSVDEVEIIMDLEESNFIEILDDDNFNDDLTPNDLIDIVCTKLEIR